MATVERQFVDEYADGTVEAGNLDAQAVTNADHVKTIAPVFYTPGTVGNDNKITRSAPVTIQGALDAKATKAGLSSGATKCKITYNADGIVTGGADLTASDITDGTLPVSRGGTGQNSLASVTVGKATNADITRTADATNGDKLQIGNGTSATIVNAKHAASADSATNVNLTGDVKTTSTTNGDTIRVKAGSGTAAEITIINAKHAASADTATNSTNSAVTADPGSKLYLIGATGFSGQQSLKTDTGIYATTESGELNATRFKVNEHCTVSYNSTKSSLDFSFS